MWLKVNSYDFAQPESANGIVSMPMGQMMRRVRTPELFHKHYKETLLARRSVTNIFLFYRNAKRIIGRERLQV